MDPHLMSSDRTGSHIMWIPIMQSLPTLLLMILSPSGIGSHGSRDRKGHSLSPVIFCRFLFVLLSFFKTAEGLHYVLQSPSSMSPYDLVIKILDMWSYVWIFVLLAHAKSRSSVRTPAVWFYVLSSCVVTVIRLFLTVSLADTESWTRELVLPLMLLILCSIADVDDDVVATAVASPNRGKNVSVEVDFRDQLSLPSFLTMNWCSHLVSRGWKYRLEISDMHPLPVGQDTRAMASRLKGALLINGKTDDLTCGLCRAFGREILRDAFFRLISEIFMITNVLLLKELLIFASSSSGSETATDSSHGFLIVFLMSVSSLIVNVTSHWHFYLATVTGIHMRTAVISLIYDKALTMDQSLRQKDQNSGNIINLMSVDADRLKQVMDQSHFLWSGPLTFAVAGYLLFQELGYSTFLGMALLIASAPVNFLISRTMRRQEGKRQRAKDDRMSKISEILVNMKIIKFFAWEQAFTDLIANIREKELSAILKLGFITAVPTVMVSLIPLLVMAVTFSSFAMSDDGNILTPAKLMFSMALLNYMRMPIALLPNVLRGFVNARVAVLRISHFLSLPDRVDYIDRMTEVEDKQETDIRMEEAILSWDKDSNPRVHLQVQSLEVSRGSLVAVIGSVGSGKSSLISALLSDMRLMAGRVSIAADVRTIAYVPQQAWILNQSVRENIVFGRELSHQKYQQVVKACSLDQDFDTWTDGDMTQVGEKGVTVSGGQKQRISIARAVYSDADVFLFDDPLSAVDAQVAKHLFDNILSSTSGLLKDKTRILVTNNLTVLSGVDQVFSMENGVATLVSNLNDFLLNRDLRGVHESTITQKEHEEEENGDQKETPKEQQEKNKEEKKTKVPAVALMQEERRSAGSVKWSVFASYIKYQPLFPVVVIMIIVSQSFDAATSFWLTLWSRLPEQQQVQEKESLIIIMSSFVLLAITGLLAASLILAVECVRASRDLHQRLLSSVLSSPITFFETTAIGQLLNRFVNDMDSVDSSMQRSLQLAMTQASQTIAIIAIVLYIIPLYSLAVTFFLLIVILMYKYWLSSERQVRRLEAVTQSYIYSHFSETVASTASIRAYGVSQSFVQSFGDKVDAGQKCSLTFVELVRYRCMRLDLIANVTVITAALCVVVTRGSVDPALIGLAIVYAMRLPSVLTFAMKGIADVESEGISVERVLEYTSLPPEENPSIGQVGVKSQGKRWPSDGVIEWCHYSARYRPDCDNVLTDLNIKIGSREKIGIVGRTGAGKSSISLSLFRMIESTGGRILIDGVDIERISLTDLRSNMTMIPQDATLFSGSIRSNLDPFSEKTDEELWHCLSSAHLSDYVRSQDLGLHHEISAHGSNMSAGERQLLCLARALARDTKILLMDEATAAVDHQTDSVIQSAIRTQFADCTVLTIAHRLETILDSDRVLVLSEGRVLEFDDPKTLLANPDSRFHALALDAGLVPSHQQLETDTD